jgi:hypothetical protein
MSFLKPILDAGRVTAAEKQAILTAMSALGRCIKNAVRDWFPAPPAGYSLPNSNALTVVGKDITRWGTPYRLRGVSLLSFIWEDALALLDQLFIDNLKINVVRVPVHLTDGSGKGYNQATDKEAYYTTRIKPVVDSILAKGWYCIIDYHAILDWDKEADLDNMLAFWAHIAPKYANEPKVLFEMFNEPKSPTGNPITLATWTAYRDRMQTVVNCIRSCAPHNVIIIGSPSWSTRINFAPQAPFAGTNLVYTYHFYPNQGVTGLSSFLGSQIPADLPVFMTEFGYSEGLNDSVTGLHNNPNFPADLKAWFDANPHVNWTAWSYSASPTSLSLLAPSGASMKSWLQTMIPK